MSNTDFLGVVLTAGVGFAQAVKVCLNAAESLTEARL